MESLALYDSSSNKQFKFFFIVSFSIQVKRSNDVVALMCVYASVCYPINNQAFHAH